MIIDVVEFEMEIMYRGKGMVEYNYYCDRSIRIFVKGSWGFYDFEFSFGSRD